MWRWAKLIGLIGLLLWIGWVGAGELNWQGQMTQGGLIIGRVAPGTRLEFDGQPLPAAPDGAFVFGFGRDAPLQARLSTLFPDGLRQDRMLAIAQRQYPIQRLDGLPPDKVTPPPLLLDRIRRENAWVDEARRRDIPQPVSYTHLVVYKRQPSQCIPRVPLASRATARIWVRVSTVMPSSRNRSINCSRSMASKGRKT